MEQGWIKLHRSIYNHWLWKEDTKLKWWLDLLLMANHSPRKILLGNHLLEVPRGSLHTSLLKLTDRWGVDKKTVKRFLDLLQKDSMISYDTTTKGTTIHISNYNDYQDFKKAEFPGESPSLSPNQSIAEGSKVSPISPLESPRSMPNHKDMEKEIPWDTTRENTGNTTMDIAMANNEDINMDNPKDTTVTMVVGDSVGTTGTSSSSLPKDTSRVISDTTTLDITVDTNNNDNNNKNFNNSNKGKEGEEGKEVKKASLCPKAKEESSLGPSTSLPPLSFATPLHKEIHNSLGDIAYRTWFMDANILSTEKSATLQVASPFMRDVINTKFKSQLIKILGKVVEIKSA